MYGMVAKSLGARLKQERERRKISLRRFARELNISPAYLVDIEKDRRLPKASLLQKVADSLDIPLATFDEFSPDVPIAVKEWFATNPLFEKVFSLLKAIPEPQEAVAKLERFASTPLRSPYPVAIYESELQAIALESAAWNIETGGDLFGTWGDIPIVYLATRAGPQAQRDTVHFRLDIDYLIRLSATLEEEWGLRYFGDWHSHHRLGLEKPSSADRRRITNVAVKNNFNQMAEFITTFRSPSDTRHGVVLHPYVYQDLPSPTLTEAVLIVLRGVSPIRSALIATSSLPEQELQSYSSFPIENITIPPEPLGRVPGSEGFPVEQITDRFLGKIMSELTSVSVSDPELYREAFGYVIVIPINDSLSAAFAFDKEWPYSLLQANWIDRDEGSTKELEIDIGYISALDITDLKEIISEMTNSATEKDPT